MGWTGYLEREDDSGDRFTRSTAIFRLRLDTGEQIELINHVWRLPHSDGILVALARAYSLTLSPYTWANRVRNFQICGIVQIIRKGISMYSIEIRAAIEFVVEWHSTDFPSKYFTQEISYIWSFTLFFIKFSGKGTFLSQILGALISVKSHEVELFLLFERF